MQTGHAHAADGPGLVVNERYLLRRAALVPAAARYDGEFSVGEVYHAVGVEVDLVVLAEAHRLGYSDDGLVEFLLRGGKNGGVDCVSSCRL